MRDPFEIQIPSSMRELDFNSADGFGALADDSLADDIDYEFHSE